MVWAVLLICAMDTTAVAKWPQEPTTFLGIAIDSSLVSQMPECPKTRYSWEKEDRYDYSKIVSERLFCFEAPEYSVRADIHGDWPLGVLSVSARLFEGRVVALTALTRHSSFADLSQLLTEKYGPPHQSWTEEYRNGLGNKFSGAVLEWRGRRIVLQYHEYVTKIDQSVIRIQTIESESADLLRAQQRLEAEKKKF